MRYVSDTFARLFWVAFAVLLVVGVAARVADAAEQPQSMTGETFAAACVTPDPEWISFCNGYVQAVHDLTAGADVCVPQTVTREDLVDSAVALFLYVGQTEGIEALRNLSASRFIQAMLLAHHPC